MQRQNNYALAAMKTQAIMKKILTLLLAALMSLSVAAQEAINDGFLLTQNVPNPFNGTSHVYLSVDQPGEVMLVIADISGQLQATYNAVFEPGVYMFEVSLRTKGTYVMGALMGNKRSSIVLFCNEGGLTNRIDFQ